MFVQYWMQRAAAAWSGGRGPTTTVLKSRVTQGAPDVAGCIGPRERLGRLVPSLARAQRQVSTRSLQQPLTPSCPGSATYQVDGRRHLPHGGVGPTSTSIAGTGQARHV